MYHIYISAVQCDVIAVLTIAKHFCLRFWNHVVDPEKRNYFDMSLPKRILLTKYLIAEYCECHN